MPLSAETPNWPGPAGCRIFSKLTPLAGRDADIRDLDCSMRYSGSPADCQVSGSCRHDAVRYLVLRLGLATPAVLLAGISGAVINRKSAKAAVICPTSRATRRIP